MFDNPNSNPNGQQAPNNQPLNQPSIPPQPNYGRPTPVQPAPAPQPQQPQPIPGSRPGGVEDMFASTDNPYGGPRYGGQPPMGNNPYAGMPMGRNMRAQNGYGGGFSLTKLLIPLLVVVVLALLGVAGWLSYNYLYTRGSMETNNLNLNGQASANPTSTDLDAIEDLAPSTTQSNNSTSSAPLVAPPGVPVPVINATPVSTSSAQNEATSSEALSRDSDSDGLTDSEERSLGTDPLNSDTDSDGLTDYAEVRIYHSNPLISDTDGDGFKDGQEVINGFDPNKAGGARLPSTTPATIK